MLLVRTSEPVTPWMRLFGLLDMVIVPVAPAGPGPAMLTVTLPLMFNVVFEQPLQSVLPTERRDAEEKIISPFSVGKSWSTSCQEPVFMTGVAEPSRVANCRRLTPPPPIFTPTTVTPPVKFAIL